MQSQDVQVENQRRKAPQVEHNSFLIVTKAVLADKRISTTAKLLLAVLRDHRNKKTGQCNPRRAILAADLDVCTKTVTRALAQLCEAGYLTIQKGQRGNTYVPCIQNPAGAKSPGRKNPAGTKSPGARGQNVPAEVPVSLLTEPDLLNQKGSAAADVTIRAAAATPPPPGVELKTNASAAPPAVAQDEIAPLAHAMAQALLKIHPQPGLPRRAAPEIESILRAADNVGETAERIWNSHAAYREYWATLPPEKFIPQLWRWLADGDWENPAVSRKPLVRETWAQMRQREKKDYDEQFYRELAEEGAWDVIRQYGGEPAVEAWRERLKTEAA
jgi:hypothetical protein